MKVGVIGAGPAGMSAAYCLARDGVEVEVFEAGPEVGGLARTIELWNQHVDIGPHRFFSSERRINELWLEVVGRDYEMVNRLTRIYYRKRFFFYPLKPFNALRNLGLFQAIGCLLSYVWERLRPTVLDGTFENWVKSRFGNRLFQIFFKTYSEKLWGISCRELDSDFAAQRIKKLSLYEAIKNAFFGNRKSQHKTLVDQFAYPLEGSGLVYRRMAEFVQKRGGSVHLRTPVKRVLTKDQTAYGIELEDGTIREFDHIVSSMPLSLMVARLSEAPEHVRTEAAGLKFRNTILIYLNVQSATLFPDQWLYIHSADLQTGRITNFRNWIPGLYGNEKSSILALEYWCYETDALWKQDDAGLIQMASNEIRQTGLIGEAEISDGFVHRIPRSYPVYHMGYREKLKPIEDYLRTVSNLSVIGRYGAFKYNNQDHSLLMGLLAAENIARGTGNDLWEINTDYDTYQESYVITSTGLAKS